MNPSQVCFACLSFAYNLYYLSFALSLTDFSFLYYYPGLVSYVAILLTSLGDLVYI